MSIVILGGNECMTRRYCDLCRKYNCKAKVYPKFSRGAQDLGTPDLLVLFTGTMSHKMLESVGRSTRGRDIPIAWCHSSSISALRQVLETHVDPGPRPCPEP